MTTWESLLLLGAVLIAIRSLMQMMRQRRDRLIEEVQKQVDEHQERTKKQQRLAQLRKENAA